MKTYCFDIDGTICTISVDDYSKARPFKERINLINKLHDEGNKIVLHTARGSLTGINQKQLTIKQLDKWNVKYDEIVFGKPAADYYIDDKASDVFGWFE